MLRLIRRHLKTCKYRSSRYRRCGCPIHVYGTLGGEKIRRALDLTSWEAASDKVRGWEASGQIGLMKSEIPTLKGDSSIAVLVNEVPVTNYDISQRRKLMELGGAKTGTKVATDELIDETLQIYEGRKRGIAVPQAQVDEAFASIGQNLKMNPKQLTQALASRGVDASSLKARLKAQLTWQYLVQRRTQQKVAVKTEDVTSALLAKGDPSQLTLTEFMLQQIVFVVPAGSSPALFSQRRREAEAFRQRFQGCDNSLEQAKQLRGVVVKSIGRRDSTQLKGPDGDRRQMTGEFQPAPDAGRFKRPREPPEGGGLRGNEVGLPFRFHLEAVFEAPEKAVGREKFPRPFLGKESHFREGPEGVLGSVRAYLGNPSPVEELKSLRDEFDVPDSAGPHFHVPRRAFAPGRFHLAFHFRDGGDAREVHGASVDSPIQGADRAPPEAFVPRHGPGLGEGGALPGGGPGLVIGREEFLRDDERPRAPLGAKVQVDPVEESLRRLFGHEAAEEIRQARKILLGRKIAWSAVGLSRQTFVDVEEIDVGRVIEFSAAQFSKAEHAKRNRLFSLSRIPNRRPRLAGELLLYKTERGIQEHVRQGREFQENLFRGFFRHEVAGEIAHRDPGELVILEAAQNIFRIFPRRVFLQEPAEQPGVIFPRAFSEILPSEARQGGGMDGEPVGEERRGAAKGRDDPDELLWTLRPGFPEVFSVLPQHGGKKFSGEARGVFRIGRARQRGKECFRQSRKLLLQFRRQSGFHRRKAYHARCSAALTRVRMPAGGSAPCPPPKPPRNSPANGSKPGIPTIWNASSPTIRKTAFFPPPISPSS